ncbi:bifunctional glycosyltransferase/CDP-glycerol:glycerophosphate glycerophosphotransferase [Nonomuraea africana]|uniref:bifunctional glycosyltransferase/CDP-glycerol:glycerophosphate glycerophosphotransferase n=1 Tax=Nonomuraea africana TaxID=46171 RepID=UPI0033D77F5A
MGPELSVVVPFHNVAHYLPACLSSLAAQTLTDLEVICVDDGSTDGGDVVVKEFAADDSRFRLIRQDQQGPGPARNRGIAEAAGRLLAFADGDDVVPPRAYDLLAGSLDRTGSDLSCGNVRCFDSYGSWPSPMHADLFAMAAERTHVSHRPGLLTDRTVWNKVYRRDFWDRSALTFPSGLYEDIPVALPAHVLARGVDVLEEVVYHWRQRDAGDRSITQSRLEPGHIEDRVASIATVRAFLRRERPALLAAYDEQVLRSDLMPFLELFEQAGEDYRRRFVERVGGLVSEIPDGVLARLPWLCRLAYHLASVGMADELVDVLVDRRTGRRFAVSRRVLRRYADHPLRHRRSLPKRLFHVSDDQVTLVAKAERVREADGQLVITGHAYLRELDARKSSIAIRLNSAEGSAIDLQVRTVSRPDICAVTGPDRTWYEPCGFEARMPVEWLSPPGTWEIRAEVTNGSVTKEGPLTVGPRHAAACAVVLWRGWRVRVEFAPTRSGLRVTSRTVKAVLDRGEVREDGLALWGRVAKGISTCRLTVGAESLPVPVERNAATFHVVVPHTLAAEGMLGLEAGGKRIKIYAPAKLGHLACRTPYGERAVVAGPAGTVGVANHAAVPSVTTVEWLEEGGLRLAGRYAEDAEPKGFRLVRATGGGVHELTATMGDGRFTVDISPGAMPVHGARLPLATGRWRFLALTAEGPVRLRFATRLPRAEAMRTGMHEVWLRRTGPSHVDLQVGLAPAVSQAAGRRAVERDYPRLRLRPQEDLVVFESWHGRRCSDSPRAIFHELRSRDAGRECVWVTRDGQFSPPDGARVVVRNSPEHCEALAAASHIVTNCSAPDWYVKRGGQMYVQTWHGTPMKSLGDDILGPARLVLEEQAGVDDRDVGHWDLLLSANRFSTEIFRRALGYTGEIAEIGRPANDRLLSAPDPALRKVLGIAPDKRVVLYAPTWREDEIGRGGHPRMRFRLDLELMRARLGDDHVLLVSAHPWVACGVPAPNHGGFVLDVSGYQHPEEALALADVLVTDYSGIAFDFAVTGKPMIFFADDLPRYRDRLRGLYLDYESEAPGPVVSTTAEVVSAVRRAEARYDAFANTFCALDDGHAAARAVDRIFG